MPSEQAPPPPKSAPGWYPDPAGVGHGLQRYFDGTNWTTEWAFSTEPPKKGAPGKAALALAALGVLVLLIIMGKSWVFDPKKDSQSTPSSSSAPAGSSTPTEAARHRHRPVPRSRTESPSPLLRARTATWSTPDSPFVTTTPSR